MCSSEQRDVLFEHTTERVESALERLENVDRSERMDKQRAEYDAIFAARDRALAAMVAYSGIRGAEFLRDPNDDQPERQGLDGPISPSRINRSRSTRGLKSGTVAASQSQSSIPFVITGYSSNRLNDGRFSLLSTRQLGGAVQEHEEQRENYALDLLLARDDT